MPKKFIEGLQHFERRHFPDRAATFRRLVIEGQKPSALFIGCSDSRVVPELLTGAAPGDLFMLRNVGNMVLPYHDGIGDDSCAAAIEYAVDVLRVRDIIVCGHTHCGGVAALLQPRNEIPLHVARWIEHARAAQRDEDLNDEQSMRELEKRNVLLQLDHLATYPVVQKALAEQRVALHGWLFDIAHGRVDIFDVETGEFLPAGGE